MSRLPHAVLVFLALASCFPAPAAEPRRAAGKRYALLVGVKEYEHSSLSNLRYTENDVAALAKLLRPAGYQVALLCDSAGQRNARNKPTLRNIQAQLRVLLARCTKRDTVLIAFAGHGVQLGGRKDAFFCPCDARPNDPRTLVSLKGVYDQLDDSGAGVKLMLVDACRNDPRNRARSRSAGVTAGNAPRPPKGIAVLFSCASGQVAYEHEDLRHGVFFHSVLEALGGKAKDEDGEVTWNRLAEYVSKQVPLHVNRLVEDARQEPNEIKDLEGPPPVLLKVLARAPAPFAPRPAAPVQSAVPRAGWRFWARHGLSDADYQKWVDDLVRYKYRPVQVSVHTSGGKPVFSALAIPTDGFAWVARHNMTSSGYQTAFDDLVGKGYRPISVAGYLDGAAVKFAALFLKDGANIRWEARSNQTSVQYQATFDAAVKRGLRPVVVNGYPTSAGTRYACILTTDPGGDWIARHGISAADYQKVITDYSRKGYRPIWASAFREGATATARFNLVMVRNSSKWWVARHNLTSTQYQEAFDKYSRDGYDLAVVSGYSEADESRYLGVWTRD
jgi:hypothetical protein